MGDFGQVAYRVSGVFGLDGPWVYVGLFALSVGESSAFLGLVLPGETFVLAAGAAAAAGALDLSWTILVVVVGAVVGDTVGYALGAHFGGCRDHGILGRLWSCARMRTVRGFLARRGRPTIFFARFVGLLRPLAPFAAGAVHMPYRPFLAYNIAGGVVWGAGTVLAGYAIGTAVEGTLRWAGLGLLVGAIAIGLAVRFLARRRASPRHRRSRWTLPEGRRTPVRSGPRRAPPSPPRRRARR